MARKAFRCKRCGRGFSMAAHLARHQNAVHGAGGRKKTGKKTGRRAGRASASPAPMGGDEGASRVLSEMSAYLEDLQAQRDAITNQIAGVEDAMNMMGGAKVAVPSGPRAGRRGPGRPAGKRGRRATRGVHGREGSLKPMIVKALRSSSAPMSPSDIAKAVISNGYQTRTSNLTKAVSNALPDIKGVRKVGRGQYRA